jgi:hypothetical protein
MRISFIIILLWICASSCKKENDSEFTLNYFIDIDVFDTLSKRSYIINSNYLEYTDTFSKVRRIRGKLIHEYQLFFQTKFTIILPENPESLQKGKIISIVSLNQDTSYTNFSLAIESPELKSMSMRLNDSSYNEITKIEKVKDNVFVITGNYKSWCIGDDSLYKFVQGNYKLPYYTN